MLKYVFTNKYYLILVMIYLLLYINTGLSSSISVYYFTYILGDASLMGVTSLASFVMIVGLMFNPALVKKFGMYKVNLVSYIVTSVFSLVMVFLHTPLILWGLSGLLFCAVFSWLF